MIDYNVYLWNTSLPVSSPVPITSDGTKKGVRYGIPDWVYEGITQYTRLPRKNLAKHKYMHVQKSIFF